MTDQAKMVYVVEDSIASGTLFCTYLESAGFSTRLFKDGKSAMVGIGELMPDIIIQDVCLPDMSGLDVLQYAKRKNPSVPVIVITANSSINIAVDAMRCGGFDFIEKPFNKERLVQAAMSATQELSEVAATPDRDAVVERQVQDIFIGDSLPMRYVFKILKSAARSKATVFVTGESGTGKELCAVAVHQAGARASGPFKALNCAAIPGELFESEIFGHVKGAFSGAMTDRKGAAELAHGGTLFLDELCEMDLSLQAKLLRFIQTGKFTPVGGSVEQTADIRFVCATNRNPAEEVALGNFREDLYYRLNVVPVHLPPLRDRGNDILMIADKVLGDKVRENDKEFIGFDADVRARFLNYDWPGNIRELQNIIEKAVVIHDGQQITAEMLELGSESAAPVRRETIKSVPGPVSTPSPAGNGNIRPLWQVEKEAIEAAIDQCDGNIPLAAACLGVSASTIYRKKKSWDEQGAESESTSSGVESRIF